MSEENKRNKRNRRYSLLATYDGHTKVIKVNEPDDVTNETVLKDKVDLSTIDLFTSNFETEEDLKDYLGLPDDCELSVVFKSGGQTKKLPLIFYNNKLLRYFASTAKYRVKGVEVERDESFDKTVRQFLRAIDKDRNFFIVVRRDPFIHQHLEDKLVEYVQYLKVSPYLINKIFTDIEHYKTLRHLIMNAQNYEKQKGVKIFDVPVPEIIPTVAFEPISYEIEDVEDYSHYMDDDNEYPFPPGSEEMKMYINYLESLPDEYADEPGYSKRR